MFNKNILIKLGSLATIAAPIATVVSCGSSITDEEAQIITDLTTEESRNKIEILWLETLLSKVYGLSEAEQEIFTNDDELVSNDWFKDIFKFYLEEQIRTGTSYLITFGNSLKAEKEYDPEAYTSQEDKEAAELRLSKLAAYGLEEEFITRDYIEWLSDDLNFDDASNPGNGLTADERFEDLAKLFIEIPSLKIKNEIYQRRIIQKYFTMSRTDWGTVNESDLENLGEVASEIQVAKNFPLIKFAVDNKPFFKWEITLETQDSLKYFQLEPIDAEVADMHFINDDTLDITHGAGSKEATVQPIAIYKGYKTAKEKLTPTTLTPDFLDNFENHEVNELISYAGVYTQTETGTSNLKFDLENYKKADSSDFWYGYIQNEELVTDKISLIQNKATEVALTKTMGLMPIYGVDGKLTFSGTDWDDNGSFEKLALQFNSFDTSLWSVVMNFYVSEDNPNRTLLKVSNPTIRDKYIEEFGMTYIDPE